MLSNDAYSLLRGSIKTVWTLEILLILRRDTERAWCPDDLIRESRSSTVIVQDALARLQKVGLLVVDADARFRYQVAAPILDRWVEEIATAYATRPAAVIQVLYSTPPGGIQDFADAFRLRKDH
ncbi:hypothetical protein [Azospirillum brasilense]|uniref:Transcriptional regulator n=1 Tax=Azospirillum brasilense TaxID=192 RepID=A0A235HBN1_AZOBR|nr:hypothetical protein [Azospirillum brasilense]OYD82884.1 hypothetical protein CHT98_18505 [Azospirillum brasilense]